MDVQRYLVTASAGLAGAGLSGVFGYFTGTQSAGGSHAIWPYGPLFGAIVLGSVLVVYNDRNRAKFPKREHPGHSGHIFISSALGDSQRVDYLQQRLEGAGLLVWRDRTSIKPGQDRNQEIRGAVKDAAAFVVCFSPDSVNQSTAYVNQELQSAIEQSGARNPAVSWLFPVRFGDCILPDLEITPTSKLSSLQPTDLFGTSGDAELGRLIHALKGVLANPESPTPAARGAQKPFARIRVYLGGKRLAFIGGVAVAAAVLMALVGANDLLGANTSPNLPQSSGTSTAPPSQSAAPGPSLPAGISVSPQLALDNNNYCKWKYGTHPMPLVSVHPVTIRIDNRCVKPAHIEASEDINTTIYASASNNSDQVGGVADGQTLPVSCWETGEDISKATATGASLSSTLWLKVKLPSGVYGYICDIYVGGGGYTEGQLNALDVHSCTG